MNKLAYQIAELCEMYSIPTSAFYKEIGKGRLRAFRRGRTYLVLGTEAERWLNSLLQKRKQRRGLSTIKKFLRRLFRKRKLKSKSPRG